MKIREFKIEDIEKGLLETYKEVWYITKIDTKIIDNFLKNDNHMFVVEIDDKIIGSATLHIQNKIIRDGGVSGIIEDVVISEKYRGRGIGEKLIAMLVEKAKDLNCYKIILSCFPERISFYEKCGFKKETQTMRMDLNKLK